MEAVNERDDDDLSFPIEADFKDAMAHLHWTKGKNDPSIHMVHVCIVCN